MEIKQWSDYFKLNENHIEGEEEISSMFVELDDEEKDSYVLRIQTTDGGKYKINLLKDDYEG